MPTIEKFLGLWTLQPEQADYEIGNPPQEGTYEITLLEDNKVNFGMAWVDQAGQSHSQSYAEIADGRLHPHENSAVADEISLTLKSDTLLESVARKDGIDILTAERHLLADDQMKVIMSGPLPQGGRYQNISIYKKH